MPLKTPDAIVSWKLPHEPRSAALDVIPASIIAVLLFIVLFGIINGFMDGGMLVSTIVHTRVLTPLPALCIVAAAEIMGLYFLGDRVARLFAGPLLFAHTLRPEESLRVIGGALLGAGAWLGLAWQAGLPTASSHGLLGGLIGAAWAETGEAVWKNPVFLKVLLFLFCAPAMGFLLSLMIVHGVRFVGRFMTPAAGHWLRPLHVVALVALAMVHGSNDGQKLWGLMVATIACGALGWTAPAWLPLVCGGALAMGVLCASGRILRSLGSNLSRLDPLQGICASTSAALLVGISGHHGLPVSTTHIVAGTIMGGGAAVQPRAVRWGTAAQLGKAWVTTLPGAACLGAVGVWILRAVHHVVS